MLIYILREHSARPQGEDDKILSASRDKELIFKKATKLSHEHLKNQSSCQDTTYWIHIFESRTGRMLDELEFSSDRLHGETFGRIVRGRGLRDERVLGLWYKEQSSH